MLFSRRLDKVEGRIDRLSDAFRDFISEPMPAPSEVHGEMHVSVPWLVTPNAMIRADRISHLTEHMNEMKTVVHLLDESSVLIDAPLAEVARNMGMPLPPKVYDQAKDEEPTT